MEHTTPLHETTQHWYSRYAQPLRSMIFAVLCAWCLWSISAEPNAQSHEYDLRPGKKLIFKDNVFEKGSSTINKQELNSFKRLAAYLAERPMLEIEISGHADNQGTAEQNIALSLARAQSVKMLLVANGINERRIRTKGYGSERPLASNDTEERRTQNRRIEIVGISPATERVLTNDQNTPLAADGKITALQPPVQSLAPWDNTWRKAHLGQQIYEYHKINTTEHSRAEITFNDRRRLQIAENSTVMIYGSHSATATGSKAVENIALVRGGLWMKLKSLNNPNEQMLIKTSAGTIELGQSTAKIGIDDSARSLISVHEGSARVQTQSPNDTMSAQQSMMDIQANFGTRFAPNTAPETPRPLPPKPQLVAPDITDSVRTGDLLLEWRKYGATTKIDIAQSLQFQEVLYSTTVTTDSLRVHLPAGVWFVRLVSVDSIGLESRDAVYRLVVAPPPAPFRFRFLEFFALTAAAILGWLGKMLQRKEFFWGAAIIVVGAVLALVFL